MIDFLLCLFSPRLEQGSHAAAAGAPPSPQQPVSCKRSHVESPPPRPSQSQRPLVRPLTGCDEFCLKDAVFVFDKNLGTTCMWTFRDTLVYAHLSRTIVLLLLYRPSTVVLFRFYVGWFDLSGGFWSWDIAVLCRNASSQCRGDWSCLSDHSLVCSSRKYYVCYSLCFWKEHSHAGVFFF